MNQELTKAIGNYHAKALDKIGSLYYTEESFDDFYYGKGSTFPDINGGIGILFEQGSSRGHAQESVNGVITFPLPYAINLLQVYRHFRLQRNYVLRFYPISKIFIKTQNKNRKNLNSKGLFSEEKKMLLNLRI